MGSHQQGETDRASWIWLVGFRSLCSVSRGPHWGSGSAQSVCPWGYKQLWLSLALHLSTHLAIGAPLFRLKAGQLQGKVRGAHLNTLPGQVPCSAAVFSLWHVAAIMLLPLSLHNCQGHLPLPNKSAPHRRKPRFRAALRDPEFTT